MVGDKMGLASGMLGVLELLCSQEIGGFVPMLWFQRGAVSCRNHHSFEVPGRAVEGFQSFKKRTRTCGFLKP